MPGWIIQGVRGEGKSLAAIGKAKEYLSRGRPVATNLDIYLEHLVEPHNNTKVFRLPDHPRSKDLNALPPAYNPKYKAEDRNGLLILDESIIWLNGRKFKQEDREKLLEWLILSRKDHWDLILLAQDHEAIDKTARSSLCDYLVQASRSDRQKQSLYLTIFNTLKFKELTPQVHRYDVFYGFSFADPPVETWEFTGTELYDAYDTNQKFHDGREIVGKKLVDMRALYSYLPASYLSKHHYIEPLENEIQRIKLIEFKEPELVNFDIEEENIAMALKKNVKNDNSKAKIILLSLVLVGFVGYKMVVGVTLPGEGRTVNPSNGTVAIGSVGLASEPIEAVSAASVVGVVKVSEVAVKKRHFIDNLIGSYRPRLAAYLYSTKKGSFGIVEFYQGETLVNRFSLSDLQSLGVAVIHKKYGIDLVTGEATYPVTAWPLQKKTVS